MQKNTSMDQEIVVDKRRAIASDSGIRTFATAEAEWEYRMDPMFSHWFQKLPLLSSWATKNIHKSDATKFSSLRMS